MGEERDLQDDESRSGPIVPLGIDLGSGEIGPLLPPAKGKGANPPEKNGVSFFRIYSKNLYGLLRERDKDEQTGELKRVYSLSDLGLLTAMMAFAEWETNRLVHPVTHQPLTISDFAKVLGMNRRHITAQIGWLKEKGLVAAVKQPDNSNVILVNAQLMWYGKNMANVKEQFDLFSSPQLDQDHVFKPAVPVVYIQRKKKEEKKDGK